MEGRLNFPSWDEMLLSPTISAVSHGSISRAFYFLNSTTGFTLWPQNRPWGLSSQKLKKTHLLGPSKKNFKQSSHIWGSPAEVSLRASHPAHHSFFNHDSSRIYHFKVLQGLKQPGSFQFQDWIPPSLNHNKSPFLKETEINTPFLFFLSFCNKYSMWYLW